MLIDAQTNLTGSRWYWRSAVICPSVFSEWIYGCLQQTSEIVTCLSRERYTKPKNTWLVSVSSNYIELCWKIRSGIFRTLCASWQIKVKAKLQSFKSWFQNKRILGDTSQFVLEETKRMWPQWETFLCKLGLVKVGRFPPVLFCWVQQQAQCCWDSGPVGLL